jgi:SOS-response transcriptional repressor LexA
MTDRHRALLDFITSETALKGCAPTRAEIATKFDWWPNAVTEALKSLQRSGAIRILPRKARGIEVIKL